MEPRLFFTRNPRLAFLRSLVEQHGEFTYKGDDLKRLFKAVDERCAELLPSDERGGWFTPLAFGGTSIKHIPPHIMYAVYALYSEMARKEEDPVSFLSGPLNKGGATAVQMEPSTHFTLMDSDRQCAPLTDILILVPSTAPWKWVLDLYGTPPIQAGVEVIGWYASAESQFTAMTGGILLYHPGVNRLLNPLALPEDGQEGLFFIDQVMPNRVQRHLERFSESIGVPLEAIRWNFATAMQVVGAYLSEFGSPVNRDALSS